MKSSKIFYVLLASIVLSGFVSSSYAMLAGLKEKAKGAVAAVGAASASMVVGSKVESICNSQIDPMIEGVVEVLRGGGVFDKQPKGAELQFRNKFRDFLKGRVPDRKTEIHNFLKSLGILQ